MKKLNYSKYIITFIGALFMQTVSATKSTDLILENRTESDIMIAVSSSRGGEHKTGERSDASCDSTGEFEYNIKLRHPQKQICTFTPKVVNGIASRLDHDIAIEIDGKLEYIGSIMWTYRAADGRFLKGMTAHTNHSKYTIVAMNSSANSVRVQLR